MNDLIIVPLSQSLKRSFSSFFLFSAQRQNNAFRFYFTHTELDKFFDRKIESAGEGNEIDVYDIYFVLSIFHTDGKYVGVRCEAKDDRLEQFDVIASFLFYKNEVAIGMPFGNANKAPVIKRGSKVFKLEIPKFFTWDEYMNLKNINQIFVVSKLGLRFIPEEVK